MKYPALILAMLLMLSGISCRSTRSEAGSSHTVPIYYATDRIPVEPLDAWQRQLDKKGSACAYYGADYNPTNLEVGVCPVNVPTSAHQLGVVERPSWFESGESHHRHFAVTSLQPFDREIFFSRLNESLRAAQRREIFVFIHGYNVTFSSAVFYTTQLDVDWQFPGVPITYSWPSDGSLIGYPRDEESVRLTEGHLRSFLKDLVTMSVATNIHLIAHSLGNRALTEVLRSFASETNQPLFGEVILAAPDVNRVGFIQDASQILPKVARHVTLYASSADKAMQVSETFHKYPRAGDTGTEPLVCEGIDTVDASDAETDLLGHSYLLNAPAIIHDMADVVCRGLRPQERNLTQVLSNGHCYWKLKGQVAVK